jgi:hypothetical protein
MATIEITISKPVYAEGPEAVFDEIDVGGLGINRSNGMGGAFKKSGGTYKAGGPRTSGLRLVQDPVSARVPAKAEGKNDEKDPDLGPGRPRNAGTGQAAPAP